MHKTDSFQSSHLEVPPPGLLGLVGKEKVEEVLEQVSHQVLGGVLE